MATNDILNAENYDRMTHNIKRIDALSKRLLSIIHQREAPNLALSAPSHELFTNAGAQYWQKMLENPEKVFMHQVAFWAGSLQHFVEAQQMAVSPSDGLRQNVAMSQPKRPLGA